MNPQVSRHQPVSLPANARVQVVVTGSRVTTCAGKAENEQWVSSVDIASMTVELEDPGGNETLRMYLGGTRTRGGEVESHGSRTDTLNGRVNESRGQVDALMVIKRLLWVMVMIQAQGRMLEMQDVR